MLVAIVYLKSNGIVPNYEQNSINSSIHEYKKKILTFAPHPDDEIIGCGGYLAQNSNISDIMVVIVTNGERGLINPNNPKIRQSESLNGLKEIGIDQDQVIFWNFFDTQIPLNGKIIDYCRDLIQTFPASEILLPAPTEAHPDHRRVTRAIIKALTHFWQGQLFFYETISSSLTINQSIDISDYFSLKTKALSQHATQIKQFDYLNYIDSQGRLRGCLIGKKYAESFQTFYWDGTAQNFFETRPLISVIIRSQKIALLKHALNSLINQEYDQIEVILVWFGEEQEELKELAEFQLLDISIVAGIANRGANLNIGVENANGEYICFLDEDDVLYQNHFSSLLPEIHGFNHIDMVYSGSRVVSCHQTNHKVIVDHQVTIINRPLIQGYLLVGNLFPIHSVLIRRSVFTEHRFNPEVHAYEDWAFFGILYLKGYSFYHVDSITNEYRVFNLQGKGYKAFQSYHEEKGYGKWRTTVLEHFSQNLSAKHIQDLSSHINGTELQISDLNNRLMQYQQENNHLKQQLNRDKALALATKTSLDALGIEEVAEQGIYKWLGQSLPCHKQFSILIPTFNTPIDQLAQAILSIIKQDYLGWEICLVDDGSENEETIHFIESLKSIPELKDKIKVQFRPQQGGIVATTMQASQLSEAPYLLLMDHDDILHANTLLEFYLVLGDKPYQLLYSDSQMIDHAGNLLHRYKKSAWAPETLLSLNYINHPTVVNKSLFEKLGGLNEEFEGGQDWELLLRLSRNLQASEICYIPKALYDWRATIGSTAYSGSSKPQTMEKGRLAVTAHLQSQGFNNIRLTNNEFGPGFNAQWTSFLPTIEIIIPTHNNLQRLKTCIHGLLEKTDYPNFSIKIIANRCREEKMLNFLDELNSYPQIQVLSFDRPFNWSAINNFAIKNTSAEAILCLNDDIQVIHTDWLKKLTRYLNFKKVGAVGALLEYPNGEIQHNGIQLHPQYVASNIQTMGSKNQLSISRNVSAVTGACLLIPTATIQRVGYFDESLQVNYGDVDICLMIRKLGQRIVQACDVRLIHHEMATRGNIDNDEKKAELQSAMDYMCQKWSSDLEEHYLLDYQINAEGTRILTL